MRSVVATVGTFDGVHRGHQEILSTLENISREKNLDCRVITFQNHPLTVIAPDRTPLWALPREISIKRLGEFAKEVTVLPFTKELASLTASEFIRMLHDRFNVSVLVMGYDNTFGSDRLTTREQYEAAGKAAGVKVEFVEPVEDPVARAISSSRLRKSIYCWDFDDIKKCLGDWPEYSGTVIMGRRLGHELGIPTMNISIADGIVPVPTSVYSAAYFDENDEEEMPAVLSIGNNPTVCENGCLSVELHVPCRELGNMYGKKVRFRIGPKIREICKFESIDMLKEAIIKDIRTSIDLQK